MAGKTNKLESIFLEDVLDIYLVPIKPNSNNWGQPDFKKIGTAFAKKWGYGHEEWNNSEKNDFVLNNQKWRAFCIQGFYNKDEKTFNLEHKMFVFISSTKGVFNGIVVDPVMNSAKEAKNIGTKVHLKDRGTFLWNGISNSRLKIKKTDFEHMWNQSGDGWKNGFRWMALKENFI